VGFATLGWSWTVQLDFPKNDALLWVSLAVLMLGLVLLAHRRSVIARSRAERARREAERENLGGNSYFLPVAPVEPAIELENPVEIDALLHDEPEAVAEYARRELEATTDIAITGGLRDLSLAIGTPPPIERRIEPVMKPPLPAPPPAAAQPVSPTAPQENSAPEPAASPVEDQTPPSVRELVLAWFEARGYRAMATSGDCRPVELILRHRKDGGRNYAFVVETDTVTRSRVSTLRIHARANGLARLLIAAEGKVEAGLAEAMRKQGVRLFDDAGIRAELGKVDIRIAAKIIAVAQSRTRARRRGASAAHHQPAAKIRRELTAARF
jgi:hypothetical protein